MTDNLQERIINTWMLFCEYRMQYLNSEQLLPPKMCMSAVNLELGGLSEVFSCVLKTLKSPGMHYARPD